MIDVNLPFTDVIYDFLAVIILSRQLLFTLMIAANVYVHVFSRPAPTRMHASRLIDTLASRVLSTYQFPKPSDRR